MIGVFEMKLIVGLGNPGKEYENTRHNAGFIFLDTLISCGDITTVGENIEFKKEKKFDAEIIDIRAHGERLILVKPQTYMNSSGKAVKKILDFYKCNSSELIVVSDDIDLPVGTVRIRRDGSSGGQKGLENIIENVKDSNFTRFRIGIATKKEQMDRIDTVNYVLGKIDKRELPILNKAILEAINFLLEHIKCKKELPSHTIDAVPKEERIEK